MSKKSIFSFILAFILTVSVPLGTYAEKETSQASEKTETTDKKNDSKNESSDKEKDEKDKTPKKGEFPELHTEYYLLADLSTGKVLKSNNGDEKIYPASTTKILTGIIALEKCNLNDKVTATKEAIEPINSNHSNIGISVGEEMTVENLLDGLLIGSANDAANVLAIHISGSLDEFTKLMNEKAKEIGAQNSHFVNAHGFHDDDHYTTVNDLAKIARYAMQNEKFREIVAKSKSQIPATNKYKDKKNNNIRYLSNTNMLISGNKGTAYLYENAIGIKTGHTDEAGYCLVSAAQKDGTELLSIIMKCENGKKTEEAYSFIDSKALLEYGFEKYKYITLGNVTDIVASADVKSAKIDVALSPALPVSALLDKDVNKENIEVSVKVNDKITAPIKKGDVLGEVTYKYQGEVLGKTNLVAVNDVERSFIRHIGNCIKDNLGFIILGILVIFVLYVYFKYLKRKKRRRAKRRHLGRTDSTAMRRRKR